MKHTKGTTRIKNIFLIVMVLSIFMSFKTFADTQDPTLNFIVNNYTDYDTMYHYECNAKLTCENTFYHISGNEYTDAVITVCLNNIATSNDAELIKHSRERLDEIAKMVDTLDKQFKSYDFTDILVAFTSGNHCYTSQSGWMPYSN